MAQMPSVSVFCLSAFVFLRRVAPSCVTLREFQLFLLTPRTKGSVLRWYTKKIFRAESFKCVTVVCRGVVCVAVGLPHTGLRLSEEGAG